MQVFDSVYAVMIIVQIFLVHIKLMNNPGPGFIWEIGDTN